MKTKEEIFEPKFFSDQHRDLEIEYEGFHDTIYEAMDEYADQFKPRWIPVSERLPEKRQKMLFCANECVHKGFFLPDYTNQYSDFSKVFISDDGGHYFVNESSGGVTDWMSLPEPPTK